MGPIAKPQPVKLIAGLIFKDEPRAKLAIKHLIQQFGKVDLASQVLPFTHTGYYESELGTNLKRQFLSFEKLIPIQALARIKIATNSIESRLSAKGSRTVNIDPGYLDLARLVLATTKDHAHRIYLARGIFAEVTLIYRDKCFTPCPWTYPDYRSKEYHHIFYRIRELYARQKKP